MRNFFPQLCRPCVLLKFLSGKFANSYLDIAYIKMDANNYRHITKMKIAIFLHVLLVGAFRFPSLNHPKSYQKPNPNIEPFLVRKEQTNATKIMKRSPLRVNRKTPKPQNQNLHPRRRKQLNAITAYFS